MEQREMKDNGGVNGREVPEAEQRTLNSETAQPDEATSGGMSPPHEDALMYAQMGWAVIPLYTRLSNGSCSCQNLQCRKPGKHPRLASWKEYQRRVPTTAELNAWWTQWRDAGVGIICGAVSGKLAVLDIDDPLLAQRIRESGLKTAMAQTPSGGLHVYVRESSNQSRNCVFVPDVADLRAEGGFAVAPRSTGYEWLSRAKMLEVEDAKKWALEVLVQHGVSVKSQEDRPPSGNHSGWLEEALNGLKPGNRHTSFVRLIGRLHHDGWTPESITRLLAPHAERQGYEMAELEKDVRDICQRYSRPDSDSVAYRYTVATEKKWLTPKELLAQEETKLSWIWEGFLAKGMIALLSARPKMGKTTLYSHLLKALLKTEALFGRPTACEGKILLLTEEPYAVVMDRLREMGLGEETNLLVMRRFDIRGWTDAVAQIQLAIEQENVSLVVVDTVSAFWCVRDENDGANVGDALQQLQAIVQQNNIGALLIHHLRKMDGEEGTAHSGSLRLVATVDFALELYKNPNRENRRNLKALSRRRETPAELIIELTPQGYVSLGAPLQVERTEVKANILAAVPTQREYAKTYEEIQASLQSKPGLTLVKELIGELEVEGKLKREGKGVKRDPYRFWNTDSVSDTGQEYKATEKEAGNQTSQ